MQFHLHHVEAVGDVVAVEEVEIVLGGGIERRLLARIDGLGGRNDVDGAPRFDLDEDEVIAMTANEVDFAAGRFEIAGQYLVALAAQEGRRDALTIIPDLLGCRQRRRRSALVSA